MRKLAVLASNVINIEVHISCDTALLPVIAKHIPVQPSLQQACSYCMVTVELPMTDEILLCIHERQMQRETDDSNLYHCAC